MRMLKTRSIEGRDPDPDRSCDRDSSSAATSPSVNLFPDSSSSQSQTIYPGIRIRSNRSATRSAHISFSMAARGSSCMLAAGVPKQVSSGRHGLRGLTQHIRTKKGACSLIHSQTYRKPIPIPPNTLAVAPGRSCSMPLKPRVSHQDPGIHWDPWSRFQERMHMENGKKWSSRMRRKPKNRGACCPPGSGSCVASQL